MARNRSTQEPRSARAGTRKPANDQAPSLTAESALAERYRFIFEAAPIGFVAISDDGLIRMVNSAIEKLFGYRREELLGQPIEMLVPQRFRTNHPSHRVGFFADPQPRTMGVGRDLAGLRKDGSEFRIEIGLNYFVSEGRTLALAA